MQSPPAPWPVLRSLASSADEVSTAWLHIYGIAVGYTRESVGRRATSTTHHTPSEDTARHGTAQHNASTKQTQDRHSRERKHHAGPSAERRHRWQLPIMRHEGIVGRMRKTGAWPPWVWKPLLKLKPIADIAPVDHPPPLPSLGGHFKTRA